MPPEEYVKALNKAVADLEDRVQRRDLLNAEIAGLRETVRVLSTLVGIAPEQAKRVSQLLALVDSATPSLTDAVRSLLFRVYPKELEATEVRNRLEDSGFNFGDFSNPLSACHAALKRLVSDELAKTDKSKEGKTTYCAVLKPTPSATNTLAELAMIGWKPTQPIETVNAVAAWMSTLGEEKKK